ncbi:MAG: aldolase/citrate lyase family protein [Chloroflexi bacterium]|nr:aldolase/citrate lyase family protein [Chloroflexota bacterium]
MTQPPKASLRNRLNQGDVLIGLMLQQFVHPVTVKIVAQAGFDFVFFEYEHSFFDMNDMVSAVLAARDNGLPVIVKTPQLERGEVTKLLDTGVHGIQLPRTETKEQVAELLDYMRYPPNGTRAVAPGWGSSDYDSVPNWPAWMKQQDNETILVAHIETGKGVENAEGIISTPGVGMLFVGTADLSADLGHPGDYDHPEIAGAVQKILDLCLKHRVPFGTLPSGPQAAADWMKRGARFFFVDTELGLLRSAAKNLVNSYRQ